MVPPPPSTSGFKDIGFGMEIGSSSLAIGSFLPVLMPKGFLATGGVSQVAGLEFPGIGITVDGTPDGQIFRIFSSIFEKFLQKKYKQ